MLVVTAVIKVITGKGNEFEKEFRELALKVRKDPGAIAYVLNRHTQNPNQYFVYEKYENEEALKYHGSTPHFQAFMGKAKQFEAGPPEINVYQECDT
ncbi:MAG: antibiotic biosynthesis monooxygenase [Dehalococcoidales bacterium]|nr:antibiotic biosynthesis monooxygenase [Dehalococcoidales bacterium]